MRNQQRKKGSVPECRKTTTRQMPVSKKNRLPMKKEKHKRKLQKQRKKEHPNKDVPFLSYIYRRTFLFNVYCYMTVTYILEINIQSIFYFCNYLVLSLFYIYRCSIYTDL